MPWCPKCENEYYDGIKVCADCGCELVEALEPKTEPDPLVYAQMLQAMKETSSEDQATTDEANVDQRYAEHDTESYAQYMSKDSKAADNRSSGASLVFVGLLGLVFLVLCYFNIIPMSFHYMVYIVMGIMFLGFFIFGIEAFLSAGRLSKEAEAETLLHKDILQWGLENIDPKAIDDGLKLEEGTTEEEMYFKRYSAIRVMLIDKYPEADKVLIDHILDDELYDKLFVTEEA